MVKHIILWKLKDELSSEEKISVIKNIKEQLESLDGKIPGLTEIIVRTEPLASSNADVMLDSTLESEDALKGYQSHPEHVKVADTYVRPYTEGLRNAGRIVINPNCLVIFRTIAHPSKQPLGKTIVFSHLQQPIQKFPIHDAVIPGFIQSFNLIWAGISLDYAQDSI